MNTDCKQLSPAASEIFKKLRAYFQSDPWKKPHWRKSGKVYSNEWYDLRKSADRNRLMNCTKSFVGFLIENKASSYKKTHGSLKGFETESLGKVVCQQSELLVLLADLDFQIETMDIMHEIDERVSPK